MQPHRSTGTLFIRIPQGTIDRAKARAQRYGMTVSAFIAALIEKKRVEPLPASNFQTLALAASRIGVVINRLREDDVERPAIAQALGILNDVQTSLANEMLQGLPAYEIATRAADEAWGSVSFG